jgi:hydrogenase maturation protease
MPMRILVLGMGNPLLTDDGVGLKVLDRLEPLLAGVAEVETDREFRGGLRLMERMVGYDRVVIVDGMQTGVSPGTVLRFPATAMTTQHSASAHDVNLPTALETGRRAGAALPDDSAIECVGIEVEDILTFGEACTRAVEEAVPVAADTVLEALREVKVIGVKEPV